MFLDGFFLGSETINLMAHRPSQSTDSFVRVAYLKILNFEVFAGGENGSRIENSLLHENNENSGKIIKLTISVL